MARLTPSFSANRVVRQYTDERYLSAAAAFRRRHEGRGSLGADLVAWQADLAKHWSSLRFGSATVQQQGEQYLFQVQVFLDEMNSEAVRVELYAEGEKDASPITETMNRGERLVGAANAFTYTAVIPANRPAADYTPRLVPQYVGALVPLEAPFILWHGAPSWR
jgi:glycogen phosphorylase